LKLLAFDKVNARIRKEEKNLNKLEELVIATKQELCELMNDQKQQFAYSCVQVEDKAKKIELKFVDVKFWLDSYEKKAKELEDYFYSLRSEMMSDCQKLQFNLDKKLEVSAMRDSFETLSGLLSVKFRQVEDLKDGLRDMLVF